MDGEMRSEALPLRCPGPKPRAPLPIAPHQIRAIPFPDPLHLPLLLPGHRRAHSSSSAHVGYFIPKIAYEHLPALLPQPPNRQRSLLVPIRNSFATPPNCRCPPGPIPFLLSPGPDHQLVAPSICARGFIPDNNMRMSRWLICIRFATLGNDLSLGLRRGHVLSRMKEGTHIIKYPSADKSNRDLISCHLAEGCKP